VKGEQAMLRGERKVLRPVQRADLSRLWELLEDLDVKSAVRDGTGACLLAHYDARFDQEAATPPQDQGWFAVEAAGGLIGQGGLYRIDYFNRRCELGIALGQAFWGKGFGQDAVRTLVDYAFTHLNMNRVALQVLADNARAVGAYRKAGFVEEGRLRQHAWVCGRFEDEPADGGGVRGLGVPR
jgi:RimJ/RimL family protein N-acetyltransferase